VAARRDFALIFIGVGVIYNNVPVPESSARVALAHGLTIAVMVSATMSFPAASLTGGYLRPAGGARWV